MPGLEIEFAEVTDPGRIRQNNEDYSGYVRPATAAQAQSHGWMFVLADGVGGQQLGEVASRTAVESMLGNFRNSCGGEPHVPLIRRLIQAANQEVYEAGRAAGPGGVAIATTVVACCLRYDRAVVAHVGDSRCYLIRGGRASALTRDHTVSAEQVRMGILSAKDGAESSQRHLLSRSLGNDLFVSVDVDDHLLAPGDVLLLCSDGFHASIEESDMAQLLGPNADLARAARVLVGLAKQRDGEDNITVQAIRVRDVERMGMYRGRPYRLR
ncbi:MAG: serine/threonine-protein phosphatase [Acidobacteria bacterium]|nr:serine/threonine-protein phosphatase [Acidobacteriota bacterium]